MEKKSLRVQERAYSTEIEQQRGHLSNLLHAILPAPAVADLEVAGRVEPPGYSDVAVLFCDVVDFTTYCDEDPAEIVI